MSPRMKLEEMKEETRELRNGEKRSIPNTRSCVGKLTHSKQTAGLLKKAKSSLVSFTSPAGTVRAACAPPTLGISPTEEDG